MIVVLISNMVIWRLVIKKNKMRLICVWLRSVHVWFSILFRGWENISEKKRCVAWSSRYQIENMRSIVGCSSIVDFILLMHYCFAFEIVAAAVPCCEVRVIVRTWQLTLEKSADQLLAAV